MAAHSTTTYTPLPSAFTCVEKPLRYVYDRYDTRGMHLAGMIVYPLIVCATPVTMVADMTIGVAECIFCTLIRGDSRQDVADLAKKKIIISPLHHLIFVITSLAESAFVSMLWNYNVLSAKFWWALFTEAVYVVCSPLILDVKAALAVDKLRFNPFTRSLIENRMLHMAIKTSFVVKASWDFISLLSAGQLTVPKIVIPIAITSLRWAFNYTFCQRMIGSFSSSWNHQAFSIFRDRGAQVKSVGTGYTSAEDPNPNTTFQDLAFTDCNIAFWKTQLQGDLDEISLIRQEALKYLVLQG